MYCAAGRSTTIVITAVVPIATTTTRINGTTISGFVVPVLKKISKIIFSQSLFPNKRKRECYVLIQTLILLLLVNNLTFRTNYALSVSG